MATRLFKTRSLAARACELGRIQCNKQPVKASHNVHVGEFLQIRTEGGEFEVEVMFLSEIRGPASAAQTLHQESETSREKRLALAQERRAGMLHSSAPENRPSKRDRRKIRQFRENNRSDRSPCCGRSSDSIHRGQKEQPRILSTTSEASTLNFGHAYNFRQKCHPASFLHDRCIRNRINSSEYKASICNNRHACRKYDRANCWKNERHARSR